MASTARLGLEGGGGVEGEGLASTSKGLVSLIAPFGGEVLIIGVVSTKKGLLSSPLVVVSIAAPAGAFDVSEDEEGRDLTEADSSGAAPEVLLTDVEGDGLKTGGTYKLFSSTSSSLSL